MPTKYRIEVYKPALRAGVVALTSHHWSTSHDLNERCFSWKYEENPWVEKPLIYVATADGAVVGMRGAYGARWHDPQGQAILAICAGDLVLRPGDRNRFLAPKIMQAAAKDLADRGYRYLINLSANRYTYLNSLRQGWRLEVEHDPAISRPQRSIGRRAIDKALRSIRHTAGQSRFAFFDRVRQKSSRHLPGSLSIDKAARPAEMADLCARCEGEASVRHVRDESFFAWRFRNPLSEYRFLFWEEASRLLAYLAVQTPTAPSHRRP